MLKGLIFPLKLAPVPQVVRRSTDRVETFPISRKYKFWNRVAQIKTERVSSRKWSSEERKNCTWMGIATKRLIKKWKNKSWVGFLLKINNHFSPWLAISPSTAMKYLIFCKIWSCQHLKETEKERRNKKSKEKDKWLLLWVWIFRKILTQFGEKIALLRIREEEKEGIWNKKAKEGENRRRNS